MSTVDLFNDYDLLQAFARLAKRLYGKEWGELNAEFTARDCSKQLEETIARKAELDIRISELTQRRGEIDIRFKKMLSEQETKELEAERNSIISESSKCWGELAGLPDIPNMQTKMEILARRKAIEERLIGAIKKGEIPTWSAFHANPHDRGPWNREKGYCYDIELSTVWWHPKRYDTRRQFIRIFKSEFEQWLKSITPAVPEEIEKLPAKDRARLHLEAAVREHPSEKLVRSETLSMLRQKFGISARAAIVIWESEVPKHLRHRGAPPKGK